MSKMKERWAELEQAAKNATPGPWVMWTSCSWRRLKNSEGVGVCVPFVNKADKHPDMEVSAEDSAFMEAANPAAIIELLEVTKGLAEALRGLDEAYCRAGPQLTRDERNMDRKRLIVARAALAKYEGGEL